MKTSVMLIDITSVTFVAEPGWGRPRTVRIVDGAHNTLFTINSRGLNGASGREAVLAGADSAAQYGTVMADPARVGVRVSMPAVFYVPGTNSAKVGPSYGDGPVLSFANGVALDSKGWTFATFDDVEKTLTCPDGTVGADVGPANQDHISATLTGLAC